MQLLKRRLDAPFFFPGQIAELFAVSALLTPPQFSQSESDLISSGEILRKRANLRSAKFAEANILLTGNRWLCDYLNLFVEDTGRRVKCT